MRSARSRLCDRKFRSALPGRLFDLIVIKKCSLAETLVEFFLRRSTPERLLQSAFDRGQHHEI
jgi:hypothetical protein